MSRLRSLSDASSVRNLDTEPATVLHGADPAVVAAFWSAALGYVADPNGEPDAIADPAGIGPRLRFRQSTARGAQPRLEIEVTGSGPFVRQQALVEAEVGRFVALGATVVGRATAGGRDDYAVVLADPEGNEFTVG